MARHALQIGLGRSGGPQLRELSIHGGLDLLAPLGRNRERAFQPLVDELRCHPYGTGQSDLASKDENGAFEWAHALRINSEFI